MNFLNKLDYLMSEEGLNKNTLSQASGIPYTTIDGWYKRGYIGAKLPTIQKLADFFNTTLDYLIRDEITDRYYGLNSTFEISHDERKLIEKYRNINLHDKEIINCILNIAYEEYEKIEKEKINKIKETPIPYYAEPRTYPEGVRPIDGSYIDNDNEDLLTIPVYELGASAGTGVFLDNPCYEMVSMKADQLSRKANFAVWVNGDSMEPRFHNGDLVLVKIQPEVEIGDIGIFVLNGEGYIKKWGGDKLISLNLSYPPIVIGEDDTLYCKGKVLGNA